jgi:hypothetical protein
MLEDLPTCGGPIASSAFIDSIHRLQTLAPARSPVMEWERVHLSPAKKVYEPDDHFLPRMRTKIGLNSGVEVIDIEPSDNMPDHNCTSADPENFRWWTFSHKISDEINPELFEGDEITAGF